MGRTATVLSEHASFLHPGSVEKQRHGNQEDHGGEAKGKRVANEFHSVREAIVADHCNHHAKWLIDAEPLDLVWLVSGRVVCGRGVHGGGDGRGGGGTRSRAITA